MNDNIINVKNLNKSFGNHIVLSDINLDIPRGEITCICGENGAGKSTLVKILAGVYHADSGDIIVDGSSPLDSSAKKNSKIKMIFQELILYDELSVTENIFINSEIRYKYFPILNYRKMNALSKSTLKKLHSDINVRQKVKNLNYAESQLIEIARALIFKEQILIFDEPTVSLLKKQVDSLFNIFQELKAMGFTIILVSNRIEGVRGKVDHIIIMRDGRIISMHKENRNLKTAMLFDEIAGESYTNRYPRIKAVKNDIILDVQDLSSKSHPHLLNRFVINRGEIVGIAGLQGSGKTQIADLIYGLKKRAGGKIVFDGSELFKTNPAKMNQLGIYYLCEKTEDNLFTEQNVTYNISISKLNKFSRLFFTRNIHMKKKANSFLSSLNFKIPYVKGPIKNISNNYLQKLAIAKILSNQCKLLLLDDPTRKLDIPSKVELYSILTQLSNNDVGIMLISSDIEELIGMCDRIYVVFNGKIVKELDGRTATSSEILSYASGAQ